MKGRISPVSTTESCCQVEDEPLYKDSKHKKWLPQMAIPVWGPFFLITSKTCPCTGCRGSFIPLDPVLKASPMFSASSGFLLGFSRQYSCCFRSNKQPYSTYNTTQFRHFQFSVGTLSRSPRLRYVNRGNWTNAGPWHGQGTAVLSLTTKSGGFALKCVGETEKFHGDHTASSCRNP